MSTVITCHCLLLTVFVDQIKACKELLQYGCHVLTSHLKANPHTDDIENVNQLVANHSSDVTATGKVQVNARHLVYDRLDDVSKYGLLQAMHRNT